MVWIARSRLSAPPTRPPGHGFPLGNIIHFAGHGQADPDDPSKSQLLLSDWQTNPLTVEDIANLKLRTGHLAYLSACSTSRSRVDALLDEGIHLTEAFHLLGFPQVVGTLWSIQDEDSAEVAPKIYTGLLDGDKVLSKKCASALHYAVGELRESTSDEMDDGPLLWSPYVHFGA